MCQKEIFKSKPPDLRLQIVELVLGVAAANVFSDFFVFHQNMFYILFLQSRRCSFQNQSSTCSWIILHVQKVLLCIFEIFCHPTTHQKKQIQPKVTSPNSNFFSTETPQDAQCNCAPAYGPARLWPHFTTPRRDSCHRRDGGDGSLSEGHPPTDREPRRRDYHIAGHRGCRCWCRRDSRRGTARRRGQGSRMKGRGRQAESQ